jgi:hypothetical protein
VGDVTLLVSDSVTGLTCPNHFMVIRTWTATDPCGNQSTALQTITVSDTLPPQLEGVPADTGVCCADSIPLPATVTAFDSCDGQLAVEFSEAVSDSSGPNMFILTRTWTATDSCGNIATDEQVITVNDTLFSNQFPLSINSPGSNGILHFSVTPNPFISTTNIQFRLSETGHASVVLYNSMGVKVKSIFDGNVTGAIYVSLKLSPDASMGTGMYLLVLRTNHGYATRQIILTR